MFTEKREVEREIRIRDLASPINTEEALEALRAAESESVELSLEAVLNAAIAATGLDDFGPDDFRDRLALMLKEVDGHPHNTAWGRLEYFNDMVHVVSSRLQFLDYFKAHPEIREIKVDRPIFIAGLPRTGTTDLVSVMAADSRLRTLPKWEARQPVPDRVSDGDPRDGEDVRLTRARRAFESRRGYLPLRELMHPTNPEFIEDETVFEGYDFLMNWGITMGSDSREMLNWRRDMPVWHEMTPRYPRYSWTKAGLQLLMAQRQGERFFGKAIWHMENLAALMNQFPDATVVFTHRDPVSVVQSIATMYAYRSRMYYTRVDPAWYIDFYKNLVHQLAKAYLRDRAALSKDQTLDLFFRDLRSNQMGSIERIYETAKFPLTARARREIEDQRSVRARGFVPVDQGRIVYNLQDDFGVDPAELRREFSYYFDSLPVKAEVR